MLSIGKVFVIAALLETEDIDFLFFHIVSYFFAGIIGDFTTEITNIVSGYFQVAVGIVAAVMAFGNLSGKAVLKDGKDITIVED